MEPSLRTPLPPAMPQQTPRRKRWRPPALKIHEARTPLAPLAPNSASLTPSSKRFKIAAPAAGTPCTPSSALPGSRSQPRFRIAGNKARTQPDEAAPAPPARRGVLGGTLAQADATAALHARLLRAALAARAPARDARDLLARGLLLRVVRRRLELYVCRAWDGAAELWVAAGAAAPGGLFCDFDALALYVPPPWAALRVDAPGVAAIVLPRRVEFVQVEDARRLVEGVPIHGAWHAWLRESEREEEVPETQEEGVEEDGFEDNVRGRVVRSFGQLSPHIPSVSVVVLVEAVLDRVGVALVRDAVGERAVFRGPLSAVPSEGNFLELSDVRVCPERMPIDAVIDLLSGATMSLRLIEQLRQVQGTQTVLVFTKMGAG